MQAVGKRMGAQELYETYLVADMPEKSSSIRGPLIRNRDGRVSAIFAQLVLHSLTGFQPHIRCRLLGGLDAAQPYFSPLKTPNGDFIECSLFTLSSSSASTTSKNKPMIAYLDTQHLSRCYFPPVMCLSVDLMGTDVAWAGILSVCVTRS
jgi:hypothetical protein